MSTCEVAIAGGGPVGLLCALLLAKAGVRSCLIRRQAPPQAGRTVALMRGSVELMREVGALETVEANAAPLRAIRLVDDTGSLLRAPTTIFEAQVLGFASFGLNIANDMLQRALDDALAGKDVIIITGAVEDVRFEDSQVCLQGADFSCAAHLVIAADGGRSILREKLGLKMKRHSYPQAAVTAVLRHSAPHGNVSTEFHTRNGPLTFVPLPGDVSSLVAVTTPEDAAYLMSLSETLFGDEIRHRSQSFLGAMSLISERGSWPLEMALPEDFAARRVMLAGEAAHVLPPIGAQGLNLGLRDSQAAAQIAATALAKGDDPGASDALESYRRSRSADIRLRSSAVDFFNRSLLSPFLPVHILRGFGLYLAANNSFLKKSLIHAGLGEAQITAM